MAGKPRLFLPDRIGRSDVSLEGKEHHYLVRVLRLKRGDRCILFGQGNIEQVCEIEEILGGTVRLRTIETREVDTESRTRITLAVATGKGKKLEEIVEHTTALGVDRICPFVGDHSVSKRDNPRLEERLRLIALEACRQSGRTNPPKVTCVSPSLGILLEGLDPASSAVRLFLDTQGARDLTETAGRISPSEPVVLFCGPEGGWSSRERKILRETGEAVSLGPRVLRTELAAVIGVGVLERCLSLALSSEERKQRPMGRDP